MRRTLFYLEAIINPLSNTTYQRHVTPYETLEEVRGKCRILGLVHPGCKSRIVRRIGEGEEIIEDDNGPEIPN